ncbi:hypothetical protein B0H14DRAFT_2387746, partial [Mycena olivaceomarginata]
YLADRLHVPPSSILILENEKATPAAILSPSKFHFLENEQISDHGDETIIFFFAGHGSRVEVPSNRMAPDSKVEAICPVDERTIDDAGEYVHTIPDYLLGWLLWELSEKEGPQYCGSLLLRPPVCY